MPDHWHAILAFPREPDMATVMKHRKQFVAFERGVTWQRDFFDHHLRDRHELEENTSYILKNPVRKGLCERAEDWVWVYRPNERPPPTFAYRTARTECRALPLSPSEKALSPVLGTSWEREKRGP